MKAFFHEWLSQIGEDPNREELQQTPQRVSDALTFLTQGYRTSLDDLMADALFPTDKNDMVIVKNIEMYSLCEHHFLPFFGRCHVGYIPNGNVLGLSKIAKIVDVFARRLQIQERLTADIAKAIQQTTNALGVGVIVEASHLCVKMIGIGKQHPEITTSSMLGEMRDNAAHRAEFFSLIRT